jgi:Fe-Mn family superoxide dismutase
MFELPLLPYNYDALEPYIDKETMVLHHDKHHAAYVNNLNEAIKGNGTIEKMSIEEILQNLDSIPEEIRTKVRNNGGGHYNHSLFWKFMTAKPSQPEEKLTQAIEATFGSLDTFKEKFTTCAISHFGSGWAWLVLDNGKLNILDTSNQDSPLTDSKTPILGIDVWEHAYYLKYQNRRADYVKAFWNVVNWQEVSERLLQVE